jgi:hypothetical protein
MAIGTATAQDASTAQDARDDSMQQTPYQQDSRTDQASPTRPTEDRSTTSAGQVQSGRPTSAAGEGVPDSTPGTPRSESPSMSGDTRVAEASPRRGQRSGQGTDVMWVLIPVELQSRSTQLSQGCWVQLYSGDNFEGRYMTIIGPADLPAVASPYGTGIDNWESAIVGSAATVTTYDDQNFRARSSTLRAGQRYPELDDSKLGLFEDIESLRVVCAPQGAQTG